MRRLVGLLLLSSVVLVLAPGSASAGGIGVYNGTGFHFGPALTQERGTGAWLDEGLGVELFLGNDESRVHARLRFAWNAIVQIGGETRHSGILGVGVKVELLPDLEKRFGLYLAGDIGVAPIVTHLKSYFFVNVGPGVRVALSPRFSIFGELHGFVRFEKSFTGGPWLFLGARIAFD